MTDQLDVEALVALAKRQAEWLRSSTLQHTMRSTADVMEALLTHIAGESARVAAAVAGAWIAPTSIGDMPAKPGLASYEYVECLILHKGDLLLRPWNCEHKVFDDEAQDDFFCDWDAISAYRVIGHERELAKTSAAIIRGEKLK